MNFRENSSLDFFGIIGIIQKVVAKTSLQNIRAPLLVADREARTSAEAEALRGSSFEDGFLMFSMGNQRGGRFRNLLWGGYRDTLQTVDSWLRMKYVPFCKN